MQFSPAVIFELAYSFVELELLRRFEKKFSDAEKMWKSCVVEKAKFSRSK